MIYIRLLVVLFMFYMGATINETSNNRDKYVGEGEVCLHYNYTTTPWKRWNDCAFIFHCPEDFFAVGEVCYSQDQICPDLSTLNYSININTNSPIVDINSSFESTCNITGRCGFNVTQFLSFGAPTSIFQLQFDNVNGRMTLTAAFELDQDDIECYGRDYQRMLPIPIKHFPDNTINRLFYKKYLLEIPEEPSIYFCAVSSPMTYALNKTDQIVGYSNTSGGKYIAKIIVPNGAVPITDMETTLLQRCNSEGFKQCKVIDRRNEVVYYYFRDFQRNNFSYIEEIFKGITGKLQFNLAYLRNIEYCLPDTTFNGIELTWNTTLIGTTTTPSELCLDDEGTQVTRRCEGDFFSGAYWGKPSRNCSETFKIPERTSRLHKLIGEDSIIDVFTEISSETNDLNKFALVDADGPLTNLLKALSVIIQIGCGLSVMGIVVIILSALLFKRWYKKRLNTIQLGIVMFLNVMVMYVADVDTLKDGPACVAICALRHYLAISTFVWMLIIARIQYLKFVKIFEGLQARSHIIIHMLIGWISPVIPVLLALLIFPDNFKWENLNTCYPKDFALFIFLILPISIIILINIAIFIAIMITVSRSKAQDYGVDMHEVQIRLAVMLFFMLGITWIFGMLVGFLPFGWFMLVCLHICTVLVSIQPFIVFLFTVAFDKSTRELWINLFKSTTKRDTTF